MNTNMKILLVDDEPDILEFLSYNFRKKGFTVVVAKGTGWNPEKFYLMIFDRWGNKCYETRDMNKGWDGRANNGSEVAQEDVYVWKVILTDIFDQKQSYMGSVTIVK